MMRRSKVSSVGSRNGKYGISAAQIDRRQSGLIHLGPLLGVLKAAAADNRAARGTAVFDEL
jgi:hypothetical protein